MKKTILTLIVLAFFANVLPLSVSNGMDSVTIEGGSLSTGIYLYTLIADGKPVDTKRMILTR